MLLWCSIGVNIGLLVTFKYFDFFTNSFFEAFKLLGYTFNEYSLNIILPVGISFYTFQTLSYTIDIYRKNLKPVANFISFATFVSFFPQLVAGPIERAKTLLPQFSRKRTFRYGKAKEGLRQILWGLFKKMVIADNCAEYVNLVFDEPQAFSGSVLFTGAVLFAIQIYADFSGYSDIAIGTAKLFGIRLMQNFAFPYFSRDIAEFWQRWHISLSTWFRDYLYIPLGGNRGGKVEQVRNIFIVFLVSGLWHGANWTFVIWGGIHAFLFIPLRLGKGHRINSSIIAQNSLLPSIRELWGITSTFLVVTVAWIFFRASSLSHAFIYIENIFQKNLISVPRLDTVLSTKMLLILIVFMLIFEWTARVKEYALEDLQTYFPLFLRWPLYTLILFFIGMYSYTEETTFIYFQF